MYSGAYTSSEILEIPYSENSLCVSNLLGISDVLVVFTQAYSNFTSIGFSLVVTEYN